MNPLNTNLYQQTIYTWKHEEQLYTAEYNQLMSVINWKNKFGFSDAFKV